MLKSLSEGRMNQIVTNVVKEDGFFPCHKTIDYSKDERQLQPQNNFCAGALIAIEKADATNRNRNTRIAVMMEIYDPAELSCSKEVIDPYDYMD